MTHATTKTVTYKFGHAMKMLKQAIEFGEAEGDYSRVRAWAQNVEAAYKADIEAERELTRNANEGAKLMHSLVTGGIDWDSPEYREAARAGEDFDMSKIEEIKF